MEDQLWPIVEFFHNRSTAFMGVVEGWLDGLVRDVAARRAQRTDGELKSRGEADRDGQVQLDDGARGSGAVGGDEGEGETSFLEYLVGETDDLVTIRQQLLNILLAARDTVRRSTMFSINSAHAHIDKWTDDVYPIYAHSTPGCSPAPPRRNTLRLSAWHDARVGRPEEDEVVYVLLSF